MKLKQNSATFRKRKISYPHFETCYGFLIRFRLSLEEVDRKSWIQFVDMNLQFDLFECKISNRERGVYKDTWM